MGVIKRQGIKNLFITYTGVIVGTVSAIFLQPVLLSTTELGFTRNLYNFSFLLSIILPIGLPNIILRFYPQYKENGILKKYFFSFIMLYFFVSALIGLSFFLLFRNNITDLYKKDSELFISYFFCVIPYSVILALNSTITGFSQAVYKSTVPSFLNDVFSRVLVILVTVLYYYKVISFNYYVASYVFIYFLITIIMIIYLIQFNLISFKIHFPVFKQIQFKKVTSYGLILCIISFTSYGLKSLDAVFLGIYSLSNVAIYSTAVLLALFIEVPLGSIERISHSKIANSFATDNFKEMNTIYAESIKYLSVFGGFIFLGITGCVKYVYEFLPPEYSKSIVLVQVLSFASLVNLFTGVNNAILFYTNQFKKGAVLLIAVFMLTVVLDILVIPVYGMLGAAVVTASISIIFNVSKSLLIYRAFGFQPYTVKSAQTVMLILAGFFLAVSFPKLAGSPILNILINGSAITIFYWLGVYKLKLVPELFDTAFLKIKTFFIK